ncbi:winged helix-turn-helix transcriptional regulator [Mycobacterium spongiae]|uniref:Transcriptional regulator n=1 Tax=Mycobacterium spongiae TaxID=886343 RepID=A0A975PX45_9MYCO|nr:helix-turn-helix domain-containing protein [Mycobacterium spongiae]QUR67363.1 transcriptional regulator [Mycobacterium spongiae]
MPETARRAFANCSVFGAIETVGDAWSWLLLSEAIIDGITRFASFQSRLGIARSTLSARLSSLCVNGLMDHDERGYRPTEMGADFFGCIMAAMAWADRWNTADRHISRRVAHIGCAQSIHAELRCAACGELVRARDVSFDRRPDPAVALSGVVTRRRAPGLDLLQRVRPNPTAATLQVIGDRWSALLIRECFYGSHRFDEFQQRLGIAPNILSHRLRRFDELGILTRTAYQHRPLRHQYRLTEKGLALYPVPLAMLAWGDRWVADGRPPVRLTHENCGRRLAPVLSCSACAAPIARSDTAFEDN